MKLFRRFLSLLNINLTLMMESGIALDTACFQAQQAAEKYLKAFLRTHLENKKPSTITHIAEVKYTESHISLKIIFEGFPELVKHAQKKGHSLDDTHKHYILGEIIPLVKEIPHLKGEGTKAQVYFQTKLSELLRVNSVGEIRTLDKLEEADK